jgi:hypothetical protein
MALFLAPYDNEITAEKEDNMQDAELSANIEKARTALDDISSKVRTIEDWRGTHLAPTKKQSEDLRAAREHLANCLKSRDAWLSCVHG